MLGRDVQSDSPPRVSPLFYGICVAAVVLVYRNALRTPFIYDDHRLVVENLWIRDLGDWRAILLSQGLRPVINVALAVDYSMWGLDPFGFHLSNVLLHVLNVLLLLKITVALAGDAIRGESKLPQTSRPEIIGLAAALLFAVHPLMTSAVTYIAGRSEVLCATFFLLALLSARQFLLKRGGLWWLLTMLLWALAAATKETAVMLPVVVLCYERFVLRLKAQDHRRALLLLIGPHLIVAAIAGLARLALFSYVEHRGDLSFEGRFLFVELNVIVHYLRLMLMPEGQTIFHAVPLAGAFEPRTLVSVLVVVVLLAVAWRMRDRAGLVTMGLAWFFVLLLPSTAIVLLDRAEPMAEHRIYLASCGLFIIAGIAVDWLLQKGTWPGTRLAVRAVMVLVLVSLGGRTIIRNAIWADPVALWQESVAKAPSHWLPRLLLGEALHAAGRHEEAITEYRRGINLQPDQEHAYPKLARAWLETGRADRAWATFHELRNRLPKSPIAANGLGGMALLSGDREGGRTYFQEALILDPGNITARQSLALIAETAPIDAREALRLCEEIQRLAPRTPGNDDCINRNRARLNAATGK